MRYQVTRLVTECVGNGFLISLVTLWIMWREILCKYSKPFYFISNFSFPYFYLLFILESLAVAVNSISEGDFLTSPYTLYIGATPISDDIVSNSMMLFSVSPQWNPTHYIFLFIPSDSVSKYTANPFKQAALFLSNST